MSAAPHQWRDRFRAWRYPIYPYLLAVYPILLLYRWNAEQLSPVVLWNPCLVALVAVFVIRGGLRLVLRNLDKASLLTACLFFLSSVTGHFFEFRSTSPNMSVLWYVIYGLLTLGSMGFLVPALTKEYDRSFFDGFNRLANTILLVLILLIPINTVIDEVGNLMSWELRANSNILSSRSALKYRPDIFYIILDGYARQDVLADYFGYDNSPFIDFLRKKGFYVAAKSRCNYSVTYLSLNSSLNMQYLDALDNVPDQEERAIRMIRQNRVMEDVKLSGYRLVHFATAWAADDVSLLADQTYTSTSLDEFRELLIKTSILRFFLSNVIVNSYRQRFYFNCEKLESLPETRRPTFVYAHFVMPHPPFVFDREGRMPPPHFYPKRPVGSRDWYPPSRYVDQLSYSTRHIQGVITKILARSSRPPIIILQSDHGPGCDGISPHPTAKMLMERTGILNAYYVPDIFRRQLYPTISPVNTFRLLFDTCFGAHWRLAPDKTFYVWGRPPYKFMDVTHGPNDTKGTASIPSSLEESTPYLPTSSWAGD